MKNRTNESRKRRAVRIGKMLDEAKAAADARRRSDELANTERAFVLETERAKMQDGQAFRAFRSGLAEAIERIAVHAVAAISELHRFKDAPMKDEL